MNVAAKLHIVSNELPEPPYPSDAKARGWRFEIDTERLFASSTWKRAQDDIRNYLLRLWVESWAQIPAGSLPDDDGDIAAIVGMPVVAFQTHREALMRGWQRCSDGRLYHAVIGEQVIALYEKRRVDRERKAEWVKNKQELKTPSRVIPQESNGIQTPEPEPEPEKHKYKRAKPAVSHLPADFGISEHVRKWASQKGHGNLEKRLEHFVGYVKANAKKYGDWDQAFMNAIRDNWAKLSPDTPTGGRTFKL